MPGSNSGERATSCRGWSCVPRAATRTNGKAISLRAAKGQRRNYAYYRCLGTDAYRFGGERVCANPQVRTDRLDAAVWQTVREWLEQPERLTAESQRRLDQPLPAASELTTVETQVHKLRQG